MRHQKKRHRLGRTAAHRKATLAALGTALIQHKRITTTEPKAKALRGFIEPLITRAKEDTSHNRRQVFRRLQDNAAVSELFSEVSAQVGDRPGGYTRVVKLGRRAGDGAALAVIELVDYNDVQPDESTSRRGRTRRGGGGRRSRSKGTAAQQAATTEAAVETTTHVETSSKAEDTESVETPVADEQTRPVVERTGEDVSEEQVAAAEEAAEGQAAEEAAEGHKAEAGAQESAGQEPAAAPTSEEQDVAGTAETEISAEEDEDTDEEDEEKK